MPRVAYLCLALLFIPAAGAAQLGPSFAAVDGGSERRPAMTFRISRGDLREAGAPARNGLIGAVPLADRLQLGVGRFNVPELAQPLSHTEPARRSADVRRRDRGIAAVGISYSF
jgi:hypothetical protein